MKTFRKFVLPSLTALSLLGSANCHAQAQSDALFQALGGKSGIDKIVAELVALVLVDPRIKNSFDEVDTGRLKEKLAEQFCELGGGPCKYSGKDMSTIHEGLAVTNAQFNALAEDLQVAMDKCDVPSRTQNKLIAKLAPMQRHIVTK